MLRTAAILLVCLLPIGAVVFGYGLSLPAFIDAEAAERLIMAPDGQSADCVGPDWYTNMDMLRTWRHPLMNSGAALMLFAATSLTLLHLARRFESDRLSDVGTPRRPFWFFVLGTPAWIGAMLALGFGLRLDQQRHFFPWCADTIAIPLFFIGIAGLLLLITFLVLGLILAAFMGRLPVPLTQWDSARPVRSVLWSAIFGFASLAILLLTVDAAVTADFLIVPSGVLGIYLLLATRAALLAPRD